MAFRTIGRDMAIQISMGGPADGTPTWGSAANYLCTARNVRINQSVDTVDVSGMCDSAKKFRVTKSEGRIELEGVVFSGGYTFADVNGPMIGNYIKVETKEVSSMSAYRSWIGVVTEWSWEAGGDDMQVERITVLLSAEVDAA